MVDLRMKRPDLGEPPIKKYVRVRPRDENIRKYIKHPGTKMRFRGMNDYVEWPVDAFTQRRIKKGEVFVEEAKEEKPKEKEARSRPQQSRETTSS